jgi:hypothetical protein
VALPHNFVTVTESRQEKYNRICNELGKWKRSTAEAYALLIEAKQDKIWEEAGFDSFKDWIEIRIGITSNWAYKIIGKFRKELPESEDENPEFEVDSSPQITVENTQVTTENQAVSPTPVVSQSQPVDDQLSSNETNQDYPVDVKHVVQQNESQSDPLPAPQEVKRLDSVGRKIPDAISGYWDRKGEVNVILTGISRLKCMVESAKQGDDPLWRDVTCQDVVNPLVRAYDEVKMALPYAVCPYCQGLAFETCQHCRGKGWMNRFAWNTFAPSELKQLIESK